MPQGVRDFWDQEDTRGVEVGFKASLPRGVGSVSASTFYTRIDNAFTFSFVAPFNAQTMRNIDEARSAGFEADIAWLPLRGLQVDFALGLLDSEILESSWLGAGGIDIAGKELPYNPRSTINVGAGYSRPVAAGWQGFGRVDYERLGRTPFDPENFAFRDPVNLLNLRGGVNAGSGWEVAIWSRNVTNEQYLAEISNPNGISWLARPRQVGVELTKRF
jgi:iron complex outermembrane receptor protein